MTFAEYLKACEDFREGWVEGWIDTSRGRHEAISFERDGAARSFGYVAGMYAHNAERGKSTSELRERDTAEFAATILPDVHGVTCRPAS